MKKLFSFFLMSLIIFSCRKNNNEDNTGLQSSLSDSTVQIENCKISKERIFRKIDSSLQLEEERVYTYQNGQLKKRVRNKLGDIDSIAYFYNTKDQLIFVLNLNSTFPDTIRSYEYYLDGKLKRYSNIILGQFNSREVYKLFYKQGVLDSIATVFKGADTLQAIDQYKVETRNGNVIRIYSQPSQLNFYSAQYDNLMNPLNKHHLEHNLFPILKNSNNVLTDSVLVSNVYRHSYDFYSNGLVKKRRTVKGIYEITEVEFEYNCNL